MTSPSIASPSISRIGALLIAVSALVAPAAAADQRLVIELNKLEQRADACRLTLLIENNLGARIDSLDFELALFDTDQRLAKLLAVSAGSFPVRKTRVRQFDIADIECASIARLLLNTVTECKGGELTADACLERTETRSTTAVPLNY